MVIGTLQLELKFHAPQSLKEKRSMLKSFTTRLKRQFNVSIAELDGMDLWQRSLIAVGVVGRERTNVNQTLDYVLDFAEQESDFEIMNQQMELL